MPDYGSTIYALSSGGGRAGVAVIRVSGPAAAAVTRALAGEVPEARVAALRTLRGDGGKVLDRGLVLWFPAPGSFTGEDVVEFHVHGGPAVVRAVMGAIEASGLAIPAEAGDFTRRAFLSGKLDLTEVEGLGDLLSADTEGQRRLAIRGVIGEQRVLFERWREGLVGAMALLEAMIDFAEEDDVPEDTRAAAGARLVDLERDLAGHIAAARHGERLRDGVQVVIAGPPNAGKSTLLNRLARRDVAIVSSEAGTTRDALEVHLDLDGYPVSLVDTAGLREAMGEAETIGIERARARIDAADLVLWLSPDQEKDSPAFGSRPVWWLRAKADLAPAISQGCDDILSISGLTGDGVDSLLARLSAFAREQLEIDSEAPLFLRDRYFHHAHDALAGIRAALAGIDSQPIELTAETLRGAAQAIGRITGRTGVEDLLDVVFREFCVGK